MVSDVRRLSADQPYGKPIFTIRSLVPNFLRWMLYLALFFILLPSGSVNFVQLHHIAIVIYGLAAASAIFAPVSPVVKVPLWTALAVATLLIAWTAVQTMALDGMSFVNPLWGEVQKIYGQSHGYISVAPGDSRTALIAALVPFAAFVAALLLCSSDYAAFNLIRAIAATGIAITIFGLLQFYLTPNLLMFDEKKFYLRDLTTVFVNRNTAANYLGMILILTIGLAYHYVQAAGFRSFMAWLLKAPNRTRAKDAFFAIALLIAAGFEFAALILTQSRGGAASTFISILLFVPILALSDGASGRPQAGQHVSAKRSSRLPYLLAAVGGVLLVALLFTGILMFRAVVLGGDDLRFCFFPSLLAMAEHFWPLGSGLGTFADVYPAFRNPACGMDGVLLLAHNFYLEGIITVGLPFVCMLLAVTGTLLVILVRGIRMRRRLRWIPASGVAVLLLQIAHNLVDFSIQNPGIGAVFAAFMGAVVTVSYGHQRGTAGFARPSARQRA
jgi:hypothetical protein